MNKDTLKSLGWNDAFQQSFDTLKSGDQIPARVIRENRGRYQVRTGQGEGVARIGGALRKRLLASGIHPTVGDWLIVDETSSNGEYAIRDILPRTSHFERQAAGRTSELQSVAANFDFLFLVSGLDGDFNLKRIQRYLSLAWNSGAQPVIVLNKADLIEDPSSTIAEVEQVARDVPIRAVSAVDPSSLDGLREFLIAGKTIALLGSSGVGKSSLINAFLGEGRLTTQSVRDDDSRGRHTTTWRELVATPTGSLLIDLPGMRELQLTEEDHGIRKIFADIEQIAKNCRFRNCTHTGEPGCAIEEAIENGDLDSERFHQFIKLTQESSRIRKRRAKRKQPEGDTQKKRREKEAYMKEIHVKLRKNANAQKKYFDTEGP